MSKTYYKIYKDASGSVGIGTTSPNHELEVAGSGDSTIRITSTSTNISDDYRIGTLQYFSSDTSSNTVVGEIVSRTPVGNFGSAFDLAFSTYASGLSEKMRILANGNVGIGTTIPDHQLHVVDSAGTDIKAESTGANLAARFMLKTTTQDWRIGTHALQANNLWIYDGTAGAYRLAIDTNGNLGIGTTDPREKLNVQDGNLVFTGSRSGDADIQSIIWHNTNSTGFDVAKIVGRTGTNIYEGIIRFETKDSGGTMAERMRIDSSGYLGISNTNPQALLHVGSGNFANPSTSYYQAHFGGLSFIFRNNYDVYLTNNSYLATTGWLTKYNGYAPLRHVMLDGRYEWHIGSGTTAGSGSGFTEYMRLNTTGLGIGTTSPAEKLHVAGTTTRLNQFYNNSFKSTLGTGTTYIGSCVLYGNGDSGGFKVTLYDGQQRVWRVIRVAVRNSGGVNSIGYSVEGGGTNNVGVNVTFDYVNRSGNTNTTDFFLTGTSKSFTQIYYCEGFIRQDTGYSSSGTTSINLDSDIGLFTDNDGHVGIGNVSPASYNSSADDLVIGKTDAADHGITLVAGSTSNANRINFADGIGTSAYAGSINFYHSTNSLTLATSATNRLSIDSTGRVAFNAYGSGSFTGTSTHYLTVDSSGNVIKELISSGTPTGSGTVNYIPKWTGSVALGNSGIYDNGSNIGIGTTSPYAKLQVNGSTQTFNAHFGQGQNNSSGNWGGISLGYSENNNNYRKVGIVAKAIGDSQARQELHFLVDSVGDSNNATLTDSKMMIDTSGYVGIGTTTPSTRLHVSAAGAPGNVFAKIQNTSSGDAWMQLVGGTSWQIGTTSSGLEFYNDNTTNYRVTIKNDGSVGIGTRSPSQKLHVHNGRIAVTDGYNIGDTDANTGMFVSNDYFYVQTAGTTRMTVANNGKVGIGTTSPAYPLDLGTGGSGNSIRARRIWASGSGTDSGFTLDNTLIYQDSGNKFNITNPGSYPNVAFTIDTSANVGIGTTSPINTFHVVGQSVFDNNSSNINIKNTWSSGNHDINFIGGSTSGGSANNTAARIRCLATAPGGAATGDLTFTVNSGDTFVDALYIQEDGNVGIGTLSPGYKLEVITPDNSAISVRATSASHGILIGGAAFSTSNAYMGMKTSYMTGVNDYMIISGISDGNTYVSAAANMATHIRGGGNDTNNQIIVRDSSYNTYDAASYHQFSGSVGIGGTPSQKLHVVGKALITDDVQLTGSNPRIDFNSNGASSLRFYDTTNAAERARFNTDGNLGIGTTSPSSTLHVVDGTSGASVLTVDGTNGTLFEVVDDLSGSLMSVNDAAGLPVLEVFADSHIVAGRYGQNDFYLDTNGNLGLGRSNPNYKLHVNGNVAFGGNYASGNDYNLLYTAANSSAQNHEHAFYFPANSTNDSVNWYLNRGNGAYGYWNIDFGGTSRFYIGGSSLANSGHSYIMPYSNLGVGTTTPTRKLHVQGEVMINPGTGASTFNDLSIGGINGLSNGEAHRINFVYGGNGNFIFSTIESYFNNGNVGASKLRFRNLYNGASNTDISMTILGNGNVGIGDDQPSYKLHVSSSSTSAAIGITGSGGSKDTWTITSSDSGGYGVLNFRDEDSSTTVLTLRQDGHVGIGTNSPSSKLQIGAGSFPNPTSSYDIVHLGGLSLMGRNNRDVYISGNAYYATSGWLVKYGGYQPVIMDMLDGRFVWHIGSGTTAGSGAGFSEEMRLTSTGLGINTAGNPSYTLDVNGDIRINNSNVLRLFTSGGIERGSIQATDTDHLIIATSGGEHIRFKDGGVSGTTNMSIFGTGQIAFNNYGSGSFSGTPAYKLSVDSSGNIIETAVGAGQVDGSGTANYIAKWTDSDTIGNSIIYDSGSNVGVGVSSPAATLDVKQGSSNTNNKLMKVADDVLSVYRVSGQTNHTVTLTCGSYFQAEVVITANQTNSGTYNNLYIRGIWSNNHTSHHWDEIENIGGLTGSSFPITVGQDTVSNSGKLTITHSYSAGSFSQMVVRVTDFYGTHSYSIT